MRRRPFERASFAVLALLFVLALSNIASGAPRPAVGALDTGNIGLRLVDVPAAAQDDPRALLYIVDHLAPGTVIHRRIEVSNTTTSVAHTSLYASAATIEDGSFVGAVGATRNELSTWTAVRPGTLDVPAGGTAMATVSIVIPDDAAPGERYGVVWAEVSSAPASDDGVTQVNRVGIRLYISVGQGGAPAADFTIRSLTAQRTQKGLPVILATVKNTGGRALDMHGTLRLVDGPGGLSAGPFPVDLGVTLPIGETETVRIPLDETLPDGPWSARLKLRSGLLVHDVTADVTFPAAGDSVTVPTTTSRSWSWLIVALVVAVPLLGCGAMLVAVRRRRAAGALA